MTEQTTVSPVNIGLGAGGGTALLLILFFFCFCCCCCYRRRRRRRSRESQSRLETQERTNPIDLATGQISGQQEIEVEGNPSYIETKKKLKSPAKKVVKDQPDNNQTRTQSFLTAKSSEPITSTPTSPHSTIQRERTPTYKELLSETDQVECDIDSQEPNYDEIAPVLEQSAHLQANKLLPLEHKYHVLCDPNKAPNENKSEARNSGDHHYEKVNNSSLVKDQYNVLKSGMEVNPLQDGVVQEDANSPNEDKYYSTTRGHKLVPVGKRLNQSDTDHYYEALAQDDTKRYDEVQVRHNTFTSLTNPPQDQEKRVAVRSHSTIENNLDPMYDEPFKTDSASISGDPSTSYLFDDPKYASKGTNGRAKPPERRVSVTTGPRKESEATNITKTQ